MHPDSPEDHSPGDHTPDEDAPATAAPPVATSTRSARSPLFWGCLGVGLVLIVAGTFVVTKTLIAKTQRKPNVLVILTDDQTLEEMKVMQNTRNLLGTDGTTFSHYYVSFPNCCPSRATYYTGQYSHNNGVRDNLPPYGGAAKLKSESTLPVWLQRSGYYTASIGKYLNQWGQDGNIASPPGWSHWFGLIDPTTYYYFGYSVSDDGTKRDFGNAESDYSTDVLGGEVVNTIKKATATDQPFYISWTPLSPHVQSPEQTQLEFHGFEWPAPVPAPRYAGKFANETLPKTASYNQADVSASPDFVRDRPELSPAIEALTLKSYRLELETLLATDEWVGKIIQTLKDSGAYEDTDVIFTSDNGLFHGEHRIPNGKVYLYENDVHLPLIAEGPDFPRGVTVDTPVGNVDLASTIATVAGVNAGIVQDGTNLAAVARAPDQLAGRGMLLENQLGGKTHSEGIHTDRYVYLEHSSGDRELFDLTNDPDEVENLHGDPGYAAIESNLRDRLKTLKVCTGKDCEGSLASGGVVPAGPPAPAPGSGGPGGSTSPRTRPPAPAGPSTTVTPDQVVVMGVAGLSPDFALSNEERTCVTTAVTNAKGSFDTAGAPALRNPKTIAILLIAAKGCIKPADFVAGVSQLLPLFTVDVVDGSQATCVATALARLDGPTFQTQFVALAAPKDVTDPAVRAAVVALLTSCQVDPKQLFG